MLDENILQTLEQNNKNVLLSYYEGQMWVRISNKKATKYKALTQICCSIGISMEQIMAFGDDYNDIEMISKCGIGVAVSNASSVVKENADYITADNNSDGVALFIKNFLGL